MRSTTPVAATLVARSQPAYDPIQKIVGQKPIATAIKKIDTFREAICHSPLELKSMDFVPLLIHQTNFAAIILGVLQ